MPELPEVETVRRGLAPTMEGALIDKVEQNRPNLRFPFPDQFPTILQGCAIVALARRAKYLLIHLDNGQVIISHLGMSGSYRIEHQNERELIGEFHHPRDNASKHDHIVFHLTTKTQDKCKVIYHDPRRFGFMLLAREHELHEHKALKNLGIEPTSNALDGKILGQLFAGKKTPLKSALLDQRLIAGLGNIYVCEALWQAQLSPLASAGTLTTPTGKAKPKADILSSAIREIIALAIDAGGSSLRDYKQADGSLGYFQHQFNVYDREGQPCKRSDCDGIITRIVQSSRSTFYCPCCQS